MRFTPYGIWELAKFVLLALGLAALCGFGVSVWVDPVLGYSLAGVFIILGVFVMRFFRDPQRVLPGGDLDIVSPADGTVTDVVTSDGQQPEFIEGQAHMLGIFLSVFDVHVNRAPLDGEVAFLRYKPGKFLDARHPDCGKLNEQQMIGMTLTHANGAKVVVVQVSGAIARRIVCPLTIGDRLARGQRFGMIKFGSRTELWIDAQACDVEWRIKKGDKVKGGATVLGVLKLRKANDNAAPQQVQATSSCDKVSE